MVYFSAFHSESLLITHPRSSVPPPKSNIQIKQQYYHFTRSTHPRVHNHLQSENQSARMQISAIYRKEEDAA